MLALHITEREFHSVRDDTLQCVAGSINIIRERQSKCSRLGRLA